MNNRLFETLEQKRNYCQHCRKLTSHLEGKERYSNNYTKKCLVCRVETTRTGINELTILEGGTK